jgi:hypothetical protein
MQGPLLRSLTLPSQRETSFRDFSDRDAARTATWRKSRKTSTTNIFRGQPLADFFDFSSSPCANRRLFLMQVFFLGNRAISAKVGLGVPLWHAVRAATFTIYRPVFGQKTPFRWWMSDVPSGRGDPHAQRRRSTDVSDAFFIPAKCNDRERSSPEGLLLVSWSCVLCALISCSCHLQLRVSAANECL